MKKVLFLLIALFMFGLTVKAECLEKEYINWANDLKPVFTVFNYNDYPELDVEKYQYAYFLSLSKTRDDITFSVIDKNGDSMPATNYEELKIYGVGLYKEVEGKSESYKIEVYGNARGTCNGELITTLSYTVPAYNEYYKTSYCDKYKDHELFGPWKGFRECHIKPNWLLIYYLSQSRLILTLTRTGSHNDLF